MTEITIVNDNYDPHNVSDSDNDNDNARTMSQTTRDEVGSCFDAPALGVLADLR